MTAIINATLVMKDHFIPNGVFLIEDGKIAAFGEARKLAVPEGCEIIDAEGLYVGPGFVDIHTRSDGTIFFQYDPVLASQHHLKHGTATLLPELYYSMDTKEHVETIAKVWELAPERENIFQFVLDVKEKNPATVTDFHDRGEIARGKRADLVFVDYKMKVGKVLMEGKVC